MRTSWMSALVLSSLAVVGCGSVQDVQAKGATDPAGRSEVDDDEDDEDDDGDEDEQQVALDQVPDAVKQAAAAAVPGFVLKSAEKETEEGSLHYCLEGTVNGEPVEIEVGAADAKVLEIERGEDDD